MQSEFSVGRVKVNAGKTVIIAEAGVNHLKDISLAERLIATAAKAGADIIKFQTYSADGLVVKESPRFWDWEGEKVLGGTQHDSYSPLATPELEFTADLKGLCDKYEIEFMSTPFDEETLGVLESLDTPAYKIASGDITNFILLDAVAATGKPIFLSTGGSTAAEVDTAVKRLKQKDASALCVMHCSLSYPTRMQDAHLLAISALSEQFPGIPIGLSDHTIGPFIPALSVGLGCVAIEKHFTVDKGLPDSADHWLSIDGEELRQMVEYCRIAEAAMGHKSKSLSKAEEPARANARRSLVAASDIEAGAVITRDMLVAKRPATGISPIFLDEVIGRKISVSRSEGEILMPNDFSDDASFKRIYPEAMKLGPV